MRPEIIVLDDELSICLFLSMSLEDSYKVHTATTATEAYDILNNHDISLMIVDLMLGRDSGLDVLRKVKEMFPNIQVIMMTAFGDIASSVEAIKLGAQNYLQKPLNIDELRIYITQALEIQRLSRKVELLSEELKARDSYENMVGRSQKMQDLYNLIDKLKNVDSSVIITGESGTGKELVARAIHFSGTRKKEPFITINCAAIPEGLLEEEFFGHKKGAFTGAVSDSAGKLELADGGTFFLDEIAELSMDLQSKLLRVIQEKETMPIGGDAYKKIDVRFIAATNRDLWKMVQSGNFRHDLYYRLKVVEVSVPPLRERQQDIPLLCSQFLRKISKGMDKKVNNLSKKAESLLLNYEYPGNVRELMNVIEYAVVLCEGETIEESDLPENIRKGINKSILGVNDIEEFVKNNFFGLSMKEVEKMMIKAHLERDHHSKRKIAEVLGISERSLFYKIEEYGL